MIPILEFSIFALYFINYINRVVQFLEYNNLITHFNVAF